MFGKYSYWIALQEESAPPLSDSEIDGDFQTNSHEREEKTDKTSNFRIPAPKRSKKIANEDGSVQEALQCMKTLTERVSKRDDYSVYGEHVGNKLRSCGRSSFEISIAQHHIDEVLFNLTMGAYGRHPYSSTYSTQHTHPALTIPAGHQNYHYSNPSSSSSSPSPSSPSSHQSNSVLPTSAVPPSSNTPYQYQSAKENNNSHP